MSILSDFYLSDAARAKDYDTDQQCAENDRARFQGVTPLEISTLWAIVEKKEWDVAMMDDFVEILSVGGGQRLIYEFPHPVVERMAGLTAVDIGTSAEAWAQTDELGCDSAEIQPVIEELVRLSQRARVTNRNLYLWVCV